MSMAQMPTVQKASALRAAAERLRAAAAAIQAANAIDVSAAKANGMPAALIDRLTLNTARIEAMAAGVDAVAGLPNPVGAMID